MILVHRLRGEVVWLNPDLIESIETTPDTVITLVDGRRAVVRDSAEDIVERMMTYRASVLVTADALRDRDLAPSLRLITDGES
jgi:flagellar protein FlbD